MRKNASLLFGTALVALCAFIPTVAAAREYDFVLSSVSVSLPPAVLAKVQPIGITCEIFGGPIQLAQTTVPITLANGSYSGSNVTVVVNYVAPNANSTPTNWSCWVSGKLTNSNGTNPYAYLSFVLGSSAIIGDGTLIAPNSAVVNGTF